MTIGITAASVRVVYDWQGRTLDPDATRDAVARWIATKLCELPDEVEEAARSGDADSLTRMEWAENTDVLVRFRITRNTAGVAQYADIVQLESRHDLIVGLA